MYTTIIFTHKNEVYLGKSPQKLKCYMLDIIIRNYLILEIQWRKESTSKITQLYELTMCKVNFIRFVWDLEKSKISISFLMQGKSWQRLQGPIPLLRERDIALWLIFSSRLARCGLAKRTFWIQLKTTTKIKKNLHLLAPNTANIPRNIIVIAIYPIIVAIRHINRELAL
jgi:hypothetical protein